MAHGLDRFFGKQGVLARRLPGFAIRPQQVIAAEAVADAMREPGGISIIEAGTGVGKTLAYLVPAVQRATPEHKIVISTHTLALQSQLSEKDVPFVQSIWRNKINSAIVKGRGNYLCMQDFQMFADDLFKHEDPQFINLVDWSRRTETGDVSELDIRLPQWGEISANPDTCKARECHFFKDCFYYEMRRRADKASILLVNHALFFADLAIRMHDDSEPTVLPDYDFVVFDEAHHMEAAATNALGVSFSNIRLAVLCEKIKRLGRYVDYEPGRLRNIELAGVDLFSIFADSDRMEFELDPLLATHTRRKATQESLGFFNASIEALLADIKNTTVERSKSLADRVDGVVRQCSRAREELNLIFTGDDKNYIRWGKQEKSSRGREITTLYWTPISVASLLNDALWKLPRKVGAAIVSATLSTNGGFAYLRDRLGIAKTDPNVTEIAVGSPFDYKHNCLLYIPEHLPSPSDDLGYTCQTINEMAALLEASGGGAFLLFTSYRALNLAYEQLSRSEPSFTLMRQGSDLSNARLLEAFRADPNAVLFGTQSFWEGVDIPGNSLRLVVIDKLPFAVPDSPVHKARVESITAAGGDWFHDFSLPQAQLKLKQGFGRLIRTVEDRGVVAILDTRIVTKGYGRKFLQYLPPARRVTDINEVRAFFDEVRKATATGRK